MYDSIVLQVDNLANVKSLKFHEDVNRNVIPSDFRDSLLRRLLDYSKENSVGIDPALVLVLKNHEWKPDFQNCISYEPCMSRPNTFPTHAKL